MNDSERYKSPEPDIENQKLDNSEIDSAGKRFLITFVWAFPIFIYFLLLPFSHMRIYHFIGFVFVTFMSGLVAMVVPSRYKFVYVGIGLLGASLVSSMIFALIAMSVY